MLVSGRTSLGRCSTQGIYKIIGRGYTCRHGWMTCNSSLLSQTIKAAEQWSSPTCRHPGLNSLKFEWLRRKSISNRHTPVNNNKNLYHFPNICYKRTFRGVNTLKLAEQTTRQLPEPIASNRQWNCYKHTHICDETSHLYIELKHASAYQCNSRHL